MNRIFSTNSARDNIDINLSKGSIENIGDCNGSIVFLFYNNGLVMAFNPKRKVWEFPFGKIQSGETLEECAIREAFEEAGAVITNIKALGYYTLKRKGGKDKIAIFSADVERFEPKPVWSETDLVKIFDTLPENISCKNNVYKTVIKYIKRNKIRG
ncbi:ADP-ribose pyrophosphatase [Gottschalkia purinilytica]|uniref:ADP-ribose pyrophosphatase n=1 Tax=Gottschalkia purinilytica TaxID=1503 RepID=A0A0L0WF97_GOTPU|nr:NUDIX domain-containing protein [Gottschalkia purinilytica]KNF10153.1 ADP-ribose pyrophosphatase [Gottschalkia purinilytica]